MKRLVISPRGEPLAHRARIRWLSKAEGGRARPPVDYYSTLSRFHDDPNHTLGNWSLVVKFTKPPSSKSCDSEALVAFLVPGAPKRLLRVGGKFELQEGSKTVAQGEIVEKIPLGPIRRRVEPRPRVRVAS